MASKRPTRRPTSSMMETAAPSRWRTISIVKAFAFARSKLAPSAMGLDRQIAAVDDELGPRDVRRLVRGEEQYGVRPLFHAPLTLHRHRAERLRAPLRIGRRLGRAHGRHDARVDRVDANAVLGELYGRRLGHDAHGTLRGVVTHVHAILAHEARDRRDVHDGSAAGFAHGGHRVLHAQEHALGVHAHQGVPGRRAGDVGIESAADPRVVDQQIELPERGHGGLHRILPVRFAGDVEFHEPRLAAGRGDLLDHLARLELEHVGHDDPRSLPRKDRRLALPHPARPTRDQRDLSRQPHANPLPRFDQPLARATRLRLRAVRAAAKRREYRREEVLCTLRVSDEGKVGQGDVMATYVLVHGAYQGGWIWKPVAERLRAAGHRVLAPTLDGCGERHDQVRPGITVATHGYEIAKLCFYEDLDRVMLVGTSSGGMVICKAATLAREPIARLSFVDALALMSGERVGDIVKRAAPNDTNSITTGTTRADAEKRLFADLDPETRPWALARYTPHPVAALEAPVELTSFWSQAWPTTVIRCRRAVNPPEAHQRRTAERLKGDWHELDTGHYPMLSQPEQLTRLLLAPLS